MAEELETVGEQIVFEDLDDKEKVEDGELDNEQAKKLIEELKTGERTFDVEDKLYRITYPTMKSVRAAEWEYSKAFNLALEEGLPMREELEDKLIARGVISEEETFEREVEDNRAEIRRLEIKLKNAVSAKRDIESEKIAKQLVKLRGKIFDKFMKKSVMLANSVEAKAEDARTTFILCKSVYVVDTDELLWKTYDDYLNDTNYLLVNKVNYEYSRFMSGATLNYIEEFPEVKVLEKK
jgi:hypothetical protein